MFDVSIQFEDISILNMEEKDMLLVQQWMNEEQSSHINEPLKLNELYERFLEYYVSECEFFLKILKNNIFVGILKGRIEFKNPNEVWIWDFYIDNKIVEENLAGKILNNIMKFFFESYGIMDFFTGIAEKDMKTIKFLKKNKFQLLRISKDFYNINEKYMDMLIFKRKFINK